MASANQDHTPVHTKESDMKKLYMYRLLLLAGMITCSAASPPANFRTQSINQESFEKVISGLPVTVRERLRELMTSDTFCGVIPAEDALYIARELEVTVHQVMDVLRPLARLYARPPISNYRVGAVSRGLSGNLYFGANVEFVGEALSFTVHAEQAATINAWVHGETELEAIDVGGAPCGYCLQFLNELASAPTLRIMDPPGPAVGLSDLLPVAFGPRNLGIEGGLMTADNHKLVLKEKSQDKVVLAALRAANMSYAPYSKGYAGAALSTKNGRIYIGPYAENAAFNPSMSPMEAAIAHLNLCAESFSDIRKAVLVELTSSISSQADASRSVLSAVAPEVELTVIYARSAGD